MRAGEINLLAISSALAEWNAKQGPEAGAQSPPSRQTTTPAAAQVAAEVEGFVYACRNRPRTKLIYTHEHESMQCT